MGHPLPTPSPQAYPAASRTNPLALVTLILGVCGFALVPVVLGHVALRQIRERGEGGTALAMIGLVLGYLAVVVYVLLALVVTGAFVWSSRQ